MGSRIPDLPLHPPQGGCEGNPIVRENHVFLRFFAEILCENKPPEEFQKLNEIPGPPENGENRDFWPFGQVLPCVKCQKWRFLRFSGGPPVFQ